MTDDHVFIDIDSMRAGLVHIRCKYCDFYTWMNSIGEYLNLRNIKCISGNEKIIKDIIE